ncbi:MAG: glucose-1-phosphate thymidylyltransferase, partial [Candidatus Bathyanammoxibius sp.]
ATLDIEGRVDKLSQVTGMVGIGKGTEIVNSKIHGPVLIGEDVRVANSFIGPSSSIGNQCSIINSTIENCVILEDVQIDGIDRIEDSLIGRGTKIHRNNSNHKALRVMLGDDSRVEV